MRRSLTKIKIPRKLHWSLQLRITNWERNHLIGFLRSLIYQIYENTELVSDWRDVYVTFAKLSLRIYIRLLKYCRKGHLFFSVIFLLAQQLLDSQSNFSKQEWQRYFPLEFRCYYLLLIRSRSLILEAWSTGNRSYFQKTLSRIHHFNITYTFVFLVYYSWNTYVEITIFEHHYLIYFQYFQMNRSSLNHLFLRVTWRGLAYLRGAI